ncbi:MULTISPECIES: terminase gpA endonuclease subunit [unclassified Mesorhizobium]|uniref:terminase gpA endonuclease subunit n=1 Tax=unclassified Mesorhizobium TaxID=325217 RepID=UPI00241556B3|nr:MULTISPECIES: terminase gpA endonuclease subunit [unclassified Mesorhizobium]MDG4854578.1 phage terminase large subunit family protein [Mesorhizobium sp. WSM4982]MDG4916100.1 phage terminase large subunit family protein [Mesorhizobium sp. WSM4983]
MSIHVGPGHPGALRLAGMALAEAIRPRPPARFREWLPDNIVLVDGPKKGELWALEDAPYLGEIADCLSLEHPCNLVTVRKSQQTGVSILALAWSLYIADTAPDNTIYGLPSIDFLQDMNSQKLQPLIEAWQAKTGKQVIFPSVSRSGSGSTIYEKRFAGGSLMLANANVATDLSGKTTRYGVKDEVSKWQTHVSGDDPETLFFGRFTAFRRTKAFKIFELSTPEIDTGDDLGDLPGHCRIDRSFKRSDQRFWNIACVECGGEFVQAHEGFHLDRLHPHKSFYVCPHCGHIITETERVIGVRNGRYIATLTGPDRHPGFHVDAFISLMMSYEAIAEDILNHSKAGGLGDKGIFNLVYGLPAKVKGNAPEYERLMERREPLAEMKIPADGLILVAGADVQHNGIWTVVVAFGEDRQCWVLGVRFFEGATDNAGEGAWTKLGEFFAKPLGDAFGGWRRIEALAVDGGDGGRTNQVLEWCRRRPNAYAVKGVGGRGVPAISVPAKKSVTKRGKRKRFGSAMLWPVGTWGLKSELFANLHKPGLRSGEPADPPGYVHFGDFLPKEYFLQLTAEAFVAEVVRGKFHEEWKRLRPDNHCLDAQVYAMAMAEMLGLSTNRADDWAALRERLRPASEPDLLHGLRHAPKPETTDPTESTTDEASQARREKWKRRA